MKGKVKGKVNRNERNSLLGFVRCDIRLSLTSSPFGSESGFHAGYYTTRVLVVDLCHPSGSVSPYNNRIDSSMFEKIKE